MDEPRSNAEHGYDAGADRCLAYISDMAENPPRRHLQIGLWPAIPLRHDLELGPLEVHLRMHGPLP